MYVYIFSAFFTIGFQLKYRPNTTRVMQIMDFINEIFILQSAYFLFLFSDFVPSSATRYSIGFFYTNDLMIFSGLNILLAFYEMIKQLKLRFRKWYFQYR